MYLFVCLFVFVCLLVCLFVACLFVCLLFVCLLFVCLFICFFVSLFATNLFWYAKIITQLGDEGTSVNNYVRYCSLYTWFTVSFSPKRLLVFL